MATTHYVPVPMSADDAQTLEALAILTGVPKQHFLACLVSTSLKRQDELMNEITGGTAAQLREKLGVSEEGLQATDASFKSRSVS